MRLLPLQAINAIVLLAVALFFARIENLAPQAVAHIALALGVLPLILAALTYFVPVLTRSNHAPASLQSLPWLASLGGLSLVAGFAAYVPLVAATHAAVTFASLATVGLLIWMWRRARACLGQPHPGLSWYWAALLTLLLALLSVVLMSVFPAQRAALRVFHLHLNLLGFIGLTALGTLQVLLPTAVGQPDPEASQRLRHDLKFAFSGVLLLSVGAAWYLPLTYFGTAVYLYAPLRMLLAWRKRFFAKIFSPHGAAASLGCATLGLLLLSLLGVLHSFGYLSGRSAVLGFFAAFLLPLVSGAATQLLPVWLRPGQQGEWHQRLRSALAAWSGVRAWLMVSGGLILACAGEWGFYLVSAGLLLLFVAGARAIAACRSKGKNAPQ